MSADEALNIKFSDKSFSAGNAESELKAFLQPFTSQTYFKSVRAIKLAVVAADILHETEAVSVASKLFRSRWGATDNTNALRKTTGSR